jgi:hypothetical protein
MSLFCVVVRLHDERGKQDTKLLIEAEDIDMAALEGLGFAQSTVYFGAKREHVEWVQTSPVETPYIMQTDAPVKKPAPRKARKHK